MIISDGTTTSAKHSHNKLTVWEIYEREKAKIADQVSSEAEYAYRIKQLANKLRI